MKTVQQVVIDWLNKERKKLYGDPPGKWMPHQGWGEMERRRLAMG